jgi:hypothetical protein
VGKITEKELLGEYKQFFEGGEWIPGSSELVDLSEADLSEISTNGVLKFVSFNESVYKKNNVTSTKTAVYAPNDFPFGLARMYSFLADESPETVHVFRDLQTAEMWLKKNIKESE